MLGRCHQCCWKDTLCLGVKKGGVLPGGGEPGRSSPSGGVCRGLLGKSRISTIQKAGGGENIASGRHSLSETQEVEKHWSHWVWSLHQSVGQKGEAGHGKGGLTCKAEGLNFVLTSTPGRVGGITLITKEIPGLSLPLGVPSTRGPWLSSGDNQQHG